MVTLLVPTLIAALVAAAIHIVRLRQRMRVLRHEAIADTLTCAFNRRHMHTRLRDAIERSRRSGERASLLLVDVDRFKAVNDTFGHAEGDRVLVELASVIHGRLRTLDALFRVGGDEFALLLSGARFADAWTVAEDLRDRIQRAQLLDDCEISVSVGVAEVVGDQSVAEWMAVADAALYRAKRNGRNRVGGVRERDPVSSAERNRPPAPTWV